MNFLNADNFKTISSNVYLSQNHNEYKKNPSANRKGIDNKNIKKTEDALDKGEPKKFIDKLIQILRVIKDQKLIFYIIFKIFNSFYFNLSIFLKIKQ